MLNATTESLSGTPARPLQQRPNRRVISVADHTSLPARHGRIVTCGAPFLACTNSIMQDEDGVPRCNSPFIYCKRYVYRKDARDAASSSGTKNMSESMIGTK